MRYNNISNLIILFIIYNNHVEAFIQSGNSYNLISSSSLPPPPFLIASTRKNEKSYSIEKLLLIKHSGPLFNTKSSEVPPTKPHQKLSKYAFSFFILPLLILSYCTNNHILSIAIAAEISPSSLSTESLYNNNLKTVPPQPPKEIFSIKDIQSLLKEPTEDQPQIKLPSSYKKQQSSNNKSPFNKAARQQPIVKGLIYLSNDNDVYEINTYETTLVITAQQNPQDDRIILGAKIPMSNIKKFPMLFNLYSSNIIQRQESQDREMISGIIQNDDLFMNAMICPLDSVSFPCNDKERIGMGKGMSKIIKNLPGMEEEDTLRAPASIKIELK